MKWLLKILGALSRPLGISSPEDTRGRSGSKVDKKPPLQVGAGRASKTEPPKNPASM